MSDPINMTAGADTLAWDIFRADNANVPEAELKAGFPTEAEYAINIAKHLRVAGWVKPRTITTVEELDALPAGVLLKDAARMLWQLTMEGQWRVSGGASQWLSMEPVDMEFPAVALHEP